MLWAEWPHRHRWWEVTTFADDFWASWALLVAWWKVQRGRKGSRSRVWPSFTSQQNWWQSGVQSQVVGRKPGCHVTLGLCTGTASQPGPAAPWNQMSTSGTVALGAQRRVQSANPCNLLCATWWQTPREHREGSCQHIHNLWAKIGLSPWAIIVQRERVMAPASRFSS